MGKRVLTALFFLFAMNSLLYAEGIQWKSWEAALNEARDTDKIIMMDVVRDGCRYCVKMDKAVFHDEKMAAYIEKNFIPVKINLSQRSVPMGIKVDMTPSFLFFSADKKMIKMIPGSWNREDFYDFLEKIILKNKAREKK